MSEYFLRRHEVSEYFLRRHEVSDHLSITSIRIFVCTTRHDLNLLKLIPKNLVHRISYLFYLSRKSYYFPETRERYIPQ